jgi:hypothetical protein
MDIRQQDEMGRACSTYLEKLNAYGILVGKLKGNTPLGSPRHRWEYNIKMDLREIEYCDTDWIYLA